MNAGEPVIDVIAGVDPDLFDLSVVQVEHGPPPMVDSGEGCVAEDDAGAKVRSLTFIQLQVAGAEGALISFVMRAESHGLSADNLSD